MLTRSMGSLTWLVGGPSYMDRNEARVCFCKGKHVSPPEIIILEGNPSVRPSWNTTCPLAAMEFMRNIQGTETWKPYAKWGVSTQRYGQNVGDVPVFANKWLEEQGVEGVPFDRNSGRKSLSRWLQLLKVPYNEHMHVHGDLEKVWRDHYQSKLLKSGYRVREQTTDADLATAALRRLANWFTSAGAPKPSVKEQLQTILAGLS